MTKTAITLYRRCRKVMSELSGRSFLSGLDRSRLQAVIQQNRKALASVDNWLPSGLIERSVFRYGVNPDVEPLLNRPLDNACTHSDLLAYFGCTAEQPCRYLELGVSVGKTFWQVLNTCGPCECWGFDIEEITPVLKRYLVEKSRHEWPSLPGSPKKTPSSITRFVHLPTNASVTYICADIFDEQAWEALTHRGFNLVLSDALHTPEALDFEWQQMVRRNILNLEHAVIMWDDLDGEMHSWFRAKRAEIARHLGADQHRLVTLYANGWLGNREFPHRLGLAVK